MGDEKGNRSSTERSVVNLPAAAGDGTGSPLIAAISCTTYISYQDHDPR